MSEPPLPPLIACGEHEPGPELPKLKSLHLDDLGDYADGLLGVIEQLATQRADTAACMDEKREKGVIR